MWDHFSSSFNLMKISLDPDREESSSESSKSPPFSKPTDSHTSIKSTSAKFQTFRPMSKLDALLKELTMITPTPIKIFDSLFILRPIYFRQLPIKSL
jgi:hypothetical protein